MRWYPVKSGGVMQPGTYTVKWQLTTVDGTQADRWLTEAEILAAEDLEKKLLVYTAGIGRPETFNTVVKWASPFYTHPLGDATLQDTTVGHTDSTSVKLVGPAAARSVVGASQFADAVIENTFYEVSAWVKTREVQGDGPGLEFGGQRYFPLITGTSEWQRIGFVCKPNPPLHTVNFALINSGSGTVWFDDFLIRPLAKDEKPVAPIVAAPKPVAWSDAATDKLLEWGGAGIVNDPGRTLLDLSKHGQHGRLEGDVGVVDDGGRRVLAFESDKGWAAGGNFTFPPPLSFTIWVNPGKLVNDWNMIATGGAWNRAWNLFLFYKQSPYSIDFRPWGKRFFTDGVVAQDKWTHLGFTDDGKTLRIFVNGAEVKAEASTGAAWAALEGPLTLGTSLYYEKPKNGLNGKLANPILWSKALSAAEMKTLVEQGLK
jgi:hypothetical protein